MAKKMMGKKMMGGEVMGDLLAEDQFDPGCEAEMKQAMCDRVTFGVSVSMLTGGEQHDMGMGVGPVVGTPYDDDPMGEERTMVTYKKNRMGARGDGASTDDSPMGMQPKDKGMISGGNRKMP